MIIKSKLCTMSRSRTALHQGPGTALFIGTVCTNGLFPMWHELSILLITPDSEVLQALIGLH